MEGTGMIGHVSSSSSSAYTVRKILVTVLAIVIVTALTLMIEVGQRDTSPLGVVSARLAGSVAPYPGSRSASTLHSEAEIVARWAQLSPRYNGNTYVVKPRTKAPYSPGSVMPGFLQDGINIVNFARYVAGLPDDVRLDANLNADGQYGSVLLAASSFSHSPPKPADMPQDFYNRGLACTSSSNIGAGYSKVSDFEESCLDDSDAGNIDRLGHRRWLLNPGMLKTGIGFADGSCTTYAFDESRPSYPYGFVAWPPAGLIPTRMFSSEEAWSITLDPSRYQWDAGGNYRVLLRRVSDNKTWSFDKTCTDRSQRYFNANFDGFGSAGNCFIFRPESGIRYQSGDQFTVTLSGPIRDIRSGSITSVSYTTRFMSLDRSVFYFAEGTTRSNFAEYICICNPNDRAATAMVTYMFTDATTKDVGYNVPANSRITVNVWNDARFGSSEDVSALVHSEEENLVVERPIYFNYNGQWTGGSDAMGATSPNTKWYFAEGSTLPGFDQYLTVQNPSNGVAYLQHQKPDRRRKEREPFPGI
jgi:hypothetical protein